MIVTSSCIPLQYSFGKYLVQSIDLQQRYPTSLHQITLNYR